MVWFTVVDPHYGIRVLTMSLLMLVAFTAAHAWLHAAPRQAQLCQLISPSSALLVQTLAQASALHSRFRHHARQRPVACCLRRRPIS
jgi:hypothetical protein